MEKGLFFSFSLSSLGFCWCVGSNGCLSASVRPKIKGGVCKTKRQKSELLMASNIIDGKQYY